MSGAPVVVVSSGGIPVTQTDNGTPMTVATNGIGTPVTLVTSGGIPVNIEGSGPPPPAVVSAFTGSGVNAANLAAYSLANIAAGAEAANRHLIAAIMSRSIADRTLDATTIGGLAATPMATSIFNTESTNYTALAFRGALVPTGTTATVAPTFSGEMLRCGVGLYRTENLLSLTPTQINSASADGAGLLSAPVNVLAGGCVIAVAYAAEGVPAWGSALTQDHLQTIETGQQITCASGNFATAQSVAAQVTIGTSTINRLLVVALR